mgnify:CR=1 FL=1|jgi:nitrogen fixation/metabolism regulation signal transduction histidine kinase
MSRWQPWARRLGTVSAALALIVLLFSAMYLAADAEGLGANYAHYYPLVFVAAALALLLLALAIGSRLWKLRRQLNERMPGARTTRRLLILLLVLALPPVLLTYGFSVRFIEATVDTWLRANSVPALEDALAIARQALQEHESQANVRSDQVLERLRDAPLGASLALEDALDAVQAAQLVLFEADGRVAALAASEPAFLLPAPPEEDALLALGSAGRHVSLQRLPQGSFVRVLRKLPRDPNGRLLQALFAVPSDYAERSARIEAAVFGTRQAGFLRESLKAVFVLILSFVVLISVFLAVLIAFDLARRVVAPITRLAQAARAVGEGQLGQELPEVSNDELGFLVRAFNQMTRELQLSQARARSSAEETERQRAYLESVLSRLSSAVLVLDREGRLRGSNQAADDLFGRRVGDYLGLPLAALGEATPVHQPIIDCALQRLQDGAIEWRQETSLAREPERQLLILRGAGLPDAGQAIVIDDTTAIDRARRDAAWSEVARRLAHEVKNPLTPIQLAAERLRRRVLPRLQPDDADVLDRATHTIVAQVDALKTLVNAFGEYARAPQLDLQPVDVNRLVDEVLDLYDSDPRLQLVRDLQAELPTPRADQGRLRQVLHNLVKNAQEASAEREVLQLQVSTRLRDDAGRQWLDLSVEDDGPGLPAGFDASWFEPYRTTKAKGTGLGLAIVRKIAEEHGGQLLAENRPLAGARFVLRLPVGLT